MDTITTKTKNELLAEEKTRCSKVGGKVAQKRVEKKLSQEELSKKLGIDGETLRKNESGTTRMSTGRLSQIAESLEEPVETFFIDVNPRIEKTLDEKAELITSNFKKIKSKAIQDSILNIVTEFMD